MSTVEYDFEKLKNAAKLDTILTSYYGAEIHTEGRRQYVLCCFHSEKTPSMMIVPEENRYYCYGCPQDDARRKGDIFDIVMGVEGISKTAAIKKVAEMAGLDESEYIINRPKLTAPAPIQNGTAALPAAIMFPGARLASVTPFPLQKKEDAIPTNAIPEPKKQGTAAWRKMEPESKAQWTEEKVVASYSYKNVDGTLRYEVLRYERHEVDNPAVYDKRFSQRWKHEDGSWVWSIRAGKFIKERGSYVAFNGTKHKGRESEAVELPGIERILFNADLLVSAEEAYLVEGEKDALTLQALGFVATTASGGVNADWLDSFTAQLEAKRIIHIPDNDKSKVERGEEKGRQGQKFADLIQEKIKNRCAEYVRVQLLDEYKDITDYLDAQNEDPDIRRELVERLVSNQEREAIEESAKLRGYVSVNEAVALYPGGELAFLDFSKRPKGVYTGFHDLDALTMGLRAGEVFLLAARPGMGKSMLAENIGTNIARQAKAVTGDWYEMDKISILTRQLCSLAGVDMQKFRASYLNPFEITELRRAYEIQKSLPFYHDDNPSKRLDDMFEKLLRFKKEHDLGLHIIDYLQLILPGDKENTKKFDSRTQEVSSLSRNIKLMAKELQVPFLVLSQLSRAPETRPGDHRPMLSDLRESGSLEQDSDMVAFIFREFIYRPEKEDLRDKAELILAKQRNGPLDTVKLRFNGKSLRFENAGEDAHYDNEPEAQEGNSYSDVRRYPN